MFEVSASRPDDGLGGLLGKKGDRELETIRGALSEAGANVA